MTKLGKMTLAFCFTAIGGCSHMGAELDGVHVGWRSAIVKGDYLSAAMATMTKNGSSQFQKASACILAVTLPSTF